MRKEVSRMIRLEILSIFGVILMVPYLMHRWHRIGSEMKIALFAPGCFSCFFGGIAISAFYGKSHCQFFLAILFKMILWLLVVLDTIGTSIIAAHTLSCCFPNSSLKVLGDEYTRYLDTETCKGDDEISTSWPALLIWVGSILLLSACFSSINAVFEARSYIVTEAKNYSDFVNATNFMGNPFAENAVDTKQLALREMDDVEAT